MSIPASRKRRLLIGASFVLLALLLSACAANAPQDTLKSAGESARRGEDLWNLVFPIAVAIFVIVEFLLVFAVIRFRTKPGRVASQFHGNTKLEIVLTVIPALILAAISVPTIKTIFDLAEPPTGDVLNVTVIAHQFWWEYRYPDLGIVTANELHIPVDVPVRMRLEGQPTDLVDSTPEVIHSFWIPKLGGKQDVVPGRLNLITLSASETGTFMGQCTEYCGLGHANMRLLVEVQEQADFDAWVSDLKETPPTTDPLVTEGEKLFIQGQFAGGPACSSCHVADATRDAPNAGPNLGGFATRETFAGAVLDNTEENLVRWLRDPAAAKQGAKMPNLGLTTEQITALVAYLQSLE